MGRGVVGSLSSFVDEYGRGGIALFVWEVDRGCICLDGVGSGEEYVGKCTMKLEEDGSDSELYLC